MFIKGCLKDFILCGWYVLISVGELIFVLKGVDVDELIMMLCMRL